MTRQTYTCDTCAETHYSALAYMLCCDPAAPGDTD